MALDNIQELYAKELEALAPYKLEYLLNTSPSMIQGLFCQLEKYGIEITEDVWNEFYFAISEKLSPEVEYEFNKTEYKNLLKLKELIP